MKIDKIIDFVSTATTADLIITLLLLLVATITISSIIYIAFYLPKMCKKIINELHIVNTHLSHLDHNNYTDNNYNYSNRL